MATVYNITVKDELAAEIYNYIRAKNPQGIKINKSAILSDLIETGLKIKGRQLKKQVKQQTA